jgi:hypothetical protein
MSNSIPTGKQGEETWRVEKERVQYAMGGSRTASLLVSPDGKRRVRSLESAAVFLNALEAKAAHTDRLRAALVWIGAEARVYAQQSNSKRFARLAGEADAALKAYEQSQEEKGNG